MVVTVYCQHVKMLLRLQVPGFVTASLIHSIRDGSSVEFVCYAKAPHLDSKEQYSR